METYVNEYHYFIAWMFQNLIFNFFFLPFLGPLLWHMEVSQARGLIRAVAASLRQSHSNAGSEPILQPTP